MKIYNDSSLNRNSSDVMQVHFLSKNQMLFCTMKSNSIPLVAGIHRLVFHTNIKSTIDKILHHLIISIVLCHLMTLIKLFRTNAKKLFIIAWQHILFIA